MVYDKRVEILFDEKEYKALEAEARRRKQSVGSVVREAVGQYVSGPSMQRKLEALERMIARRGPVGSPEEIKQAIGESKLQGLPTYDETD